MACCKCNAERATVYCVDCGDNFCASCCARIHQHNDEDHSLEPVAEFQGLHIVTPLVDEGLLLVGLWQLAKRVAFPDDYFTGAVYCSFIDQVRLGITRADAGAAAMLRGTLQEACTLEDSLWRFFGDFWLRSMVTESDSVVLLLSSAMPVIFTDIAVVWILVPAFSAVYALFFWVVHGIESRLPRMEISARLAEASAAINIIDLVDDSPLVTAPRFGPTSDVIDSICYWAGRSTRMPRFYFERISSKLESLVHWSFISVFVMRTICIFLGPRTLAPLLVSLLALALSVSRKTRQWLLSRRLVAIAVVLLFVTFQGVVAYEEHVLRFQASGANFAVSDKLFWHVATGVFLISQAGVTKALQSLCMTVPLTLIAIPIFSGVSRLWKLCRAEGLWPRPS